MPANLRFGLSRLGALCVLVLACGGRADGRDDEPESPPEQPPGGAAVQEAVNGLANAYRALCACEVARSTDGMCDPKEEFEGYDPEGVRETLVRHAERGDGFTECIRDIVKPLSDCLSTAVGCDYGGCPHVADLLDDNKVLAELGESCPSRY